jgi:hypothetical protein
MSEFSERDLERLLREIGPLEAVPDEVAKRMDETVERFLAAEVNKKRSRYVTTPWVLAAGLTLVFGFGGTLNQVASTRIVEVSTPATSSSPQAKSDDVLTSSGDVPVSTAKQVPEFSSDFDYAKGVVVEELPFEPISDYGNLSALSPKVTTCLTSLGLNESVSFLDRARYASQEVTAVWSAITRDTWQISVINDACEGIAELIVDRKK